MEKYTLNDTIYRFALKRGNVANQVFSPGINLRVVGGSATQIYANDELLYRATSDIDFVPSQKVSKSEAKKWGEFLNLDLTSLGHSVSNRRSHTGHEVAFNGLEQSLFIHLDNYTHSFWEKNQSRIREEDERANTFDFEGERIRVVRPEDVIAGKIKRISYLFRINYYNAPEEQLYHELNQGKIDTMSLPDLYQINRDLELERKRNLEAFAKMDPQQVETQIKRYLARKDLYDALVIIHAYQAGNIEFDRTLFLKAKKLALDLA